jgi:hypothetical protein
MITKLFASKEIKMFCEAMLDTYWEWENVYYEVINTEKNQFIWVANGVELLTLNNYKIPYWDRKYLHRKLKELFAKQVLDPDNRYASTGRAIQTS